MRKLFTLLVAALFVNAAIGQVALTYQVHGLTPEKTNEMKLVNYLKPGDTGANVIWDFTGLEIKKDFKGYVTDLTEATFLGDFPQANVVLNEFGNQFVFQSDETGIVQYGYVSKSGRTKIVYNEPFVKLRFPFNYSDVISGNFEGIYVSGENYKADIEGKYEVVADAYGTLLLPDNIKLLNTLRVKTVKKYTQSKNNYTFDVENTTYRWYTKDLKYPVLVFIESKYNSNGKTHTSFQAAYRDKYVWENTKEQQVDIDSELKVISVFPNPVEDNFTVDYQITGNAKVTISIFNIDKGTKVGELFNEVQKAGEYSQELRVNDINLAPGTYMLTVKANDRAVSEKIVVVK